MTFMDQYYTNLFKQKPLILWHNLLVRTMPKPVILIAWLLIFLELRKKNIATEAQTTRDRENR